MKKPLIFLFMVMLFSAGNGLTAYSQLYKTAAGARLGFFNGGTVKHFLQEGRAIEGIVATRWNGFILTGLYEYQREFPDVTNLEWFVGGGAHVGFWRDGTGRFAGENTQVFGLDLILGVEYTFDEIPFTASLDWKPAFNIAGSTSWWGDGLALSVRYIFNR